MVNKLPITAMVVGRNEAHLLDRCFSSISFCDEILYTDIQSIDDSKLVALKYVSKIYDSSIIPSCEYAQAEMVTEAKNEWVLFIDPDEYIDLCLSKQIVKLFPGLTKSPSTGALVVPWQFYFKSRKLKGTVWGNNSKFLLVNKYKFTFKPVIHYGRFLNDGFTACTIEKADSMNNVIHHYWMNSYKTFIHKHMRYLKNEGKDRFNAGIRISFRQLIRTPLREFRYSFIDKEGYKDGMLGLFLSIFWAFYQSYANTSLFLICKGIIK